LGVQLGEGGVGEVDLAPNLDDVGPAFPSQATGNVGDGEKVGGDVLAHPAITPGGAAHQDPALIAQGGREPVDLGFGRIGNRRLIEPQEPADPGVELLRLGV